MRCINLLSAIFILIIMCMRVIQSIYSKKTSLLMPRTIKSYIIYMALYQGLAAGFAAITLFAQADFSGCNAATILIAACSGTALTIGALCGLKALMGGTMVLSSVFSSAGLIVPCVLGIFAFNEKLSIIHIICIIVILISTILLIDSSKKISGSFSLKTLFYLITSFLANGMTMFCQKLFGMIMPNGNVSLFSLLTFLIPSIVLLILGIIMPNQEETNDKISKSLVKCAVYQAFAVFVIQQLVTMLTPTMHSAVLFTLVNGSATIITAICGAMLYHEKITAKSAIGILLGVASLIAINAF